MRVPAFRSDLRRRIELLQVLIEHRDESRRDAGLGTVVFKAPCDGIGVDRLVD